MSYDVACLHARPVVGDQNLVGQYALLHHAVETQIEGAGPVVGGYDQRYCHRV